MKTENKSQIKKVTLLFAPPSKQYDLKWSIERLNDPLQAGSAILAAHLKKEISDLEVKCLGSQVVTGKDITDYSSRYRTVEEVVELCRESDIVGMTILLNNLSSSLAIANELKRKNPKQKIILGGPGIADLDTASLVLKKSDAVDFIVRGDGEESLVSLVNEESPENIPNLVYLANGKISSTPKKPFDICKRPIFDFTATPDHQDVLRAFDSRTQLYKQLRGDFGNFLGRIGVQFSKGCEKAAQMGPCKYCTSARDAKVEMSDAKKFWEQVNHLNKTHGITEYFIVDNILATPEKVYLLLEARKSVAVSDSIQFRAYGYVPYFRGEEGRKMMSKLKKIGVANLFIGLENFDSAVNEASNKPGFNFGEVYNIVKSASENGIDMFLPIMLGLPGESSNTLEINMHCLETLLKEFGRKDYGKGGLVRIDLSEAMPLRGTPGFNQLVRISGVVEFYRANTGKDLFEDIDPNYDVLREASNKYLSKTGDLLTNQRKSFESLQRMCLKYLRPEQIGGYEPKLGYLK